MHSGEHKATREAEYRYPLADRPWLRVKCTPVYEPGHRFGGVFILLERIDRERFAESSLAALRQALESVGEMVMVFAIENPGRLPPGFDLDKIATSVSGLGLVKAMLPRRGAKFTLEQMGAVVTARLNLFPPSIREDSV